MTAQTVDFVRGIRTELMHEGPEGHCTARFTVSLPSWEAAKRIQKEVEILVTRERAKMKVPLREV